MLLSALTHLKYFYSFSILLTLHILWSFLWRLCGTIKHYKIPCLQGFSHFLLCGGFFLVLVVYFIFIFYLFKKLLYYKNNLHISTDTIVKTFLAPQSLLKSPLFLHYLEIISTNHIFYLFKWN